MEKLLEDMRGAEQEFEQLFSVPMRLDTKYIYELVYPLARTMLSQMDLVGCVYLCARLEQLRAALGGTFGDGSMLFDVIHATQRKVVQLYA